MVTTGSWPLIAVAAFTLILSAAACFALLIFLLPILQRFALARPNARSSHQVPTPQGGGIGVIVATLCASFAAAIISGVRADEFALLPVAAAAIVLAIVGMIDDVRPMRILTRLFFQIAAAVVVVATIPPDHRVVAAMPYWLERTAMVLAALWFINLFNFMDGIDWISVSETIPITLGLVIFGVFGTLSTSHTLIAVALCGSMIGFAPFNRPVAKLFLGDVGSLPIGLMLAWLLLNLAAQGHILAALLLPLYYLADATITLLRRLVRGEALWKAHRSHYYQRATDHGHTVIKIVARIFAVNIGLIALSAITLLWTGMIAQTLSLAVGAVLVAFLLMSFERGRVQPARP